MGMMKQIGDQQTTTGGRTGSFCRLPAATSARGEIATQGGAMDPTNPRLDASANNVKGGRPLAGKNGRDLAWQPAVRRRRGTAVAFAELFLHRLRS
jgi:hypothetical protein